MIDQFLGQYFFLSNFYPCTVKFRNHIFPTSENAYQAAKLQDEEMWERFYHIPPGKAKRLGKKVLLRSDWEKIKDRIMLEVVGCKFLQNLDLRAKLIATGDEELIEGNTWHDDYWGVHTPDVGKNKLGKILMALRNNFQLEEKLHVT